MNATTFAPVSAALAALLAVSLPAGSLRSQLTFVVPSANAPGVPFNNNNLPFAGPPLRYQQIYKAADILQSIPGPVRISAVSFQGTTAGQLGDIVTMDVGIAHAVAQPSSSFASNIKSDFLQIRAQTPVTLPTSATTFFFTIGFGTSQWVWNGADDILLDVKILSNQNHANQGFQWHLASRASAQTAVRRLYANGSNSTSATTDQDGVGLITQFTFQFGVNINYGTGCQGQGGFVPRAGAVGTPVVNTPNFQFLVTRALPQVPALLFLGRNRNSWNGIPLPFDLTSIGAPGCTLNTNIILTFSALTGGGNPGTGTATVPFPLPPVTQFIGTVLTTQWLILDGSQNAAGFVMSDGLQTVIG